jgi:hypothetical protein
LKVRGLMFKKLIVLALLVLSLCGLAQGNYIPVTATDFNGEVLTYESGLGSLNLSSEGIIQELIEMNLARDLTIDERFARTIPLKLVLGVGASELVADLSDLNLQVLELSVDLGSAEVILPALGVTEVILNVGAGGVLFKVPTSRSVEVVKSEANLSSLEISDSLISHTENPVRLFATMGLGGVEIEAIE